MLKLPAPKPDYAWKYHRLMGYLEARAAVAGVNRATDHPIEVAVHDALQGVADYAKIMDIEDHESLGGDSAKS